MGFSVGSSPGNSTLLAELIPQDGLPMEAEGTPEQSGEETAVKQQAAQGTLQGSGKQYTFAGPLTNDLPSKFSDSLLANNRPQKFNPAESQNHLSFKESTIKEKVFKTLESHSQSPLEDQSGQKSASKTPLKPHAKTDKAATQALKDAKIPLSPAKVREYAQKLQQHTSRVREQHSSHESRGKERHKETERKQSQETAKTNSRGKETEEQVKQQEKLRDQEEGRGGQHQGQSDGGDDGEGHSTSSRAGKIDAVFAKEFNTYSAEESILSEIFNMRVSQFDVILLFLEIMKLDIKSREQQKLGRQVEREMQLMHMQKVVDNYKQQADWSLFSNLGAGVLGIISGAAPIAGYMKGDWIIEKLGGVFSTIQGIEKNKFFEGVHDITDAMSKMQKSVGDIQHIYSESTRFFDQNMSDLYKSDWDESTRTMDEIKDNWKGIENFLYQTLQMYHDAIRSLYN